MSRGGGNGGKKAVPLGKMQMTFNSVFGSFHGTRVYAQSTMKELIEEYGYCILPELQVPHFQLMGLFDNCIAREPLVYNPWLIFPRRELERNKNANYFINITPNNSSSDNDPHHLFSNPVAHVSPKFLGKELLSANGYLPITREDCRDITEEHMRLRTGTLSIVTPKDDVRATLKERGWLRLSDIVTVVKEVPNKPSVCVFRPAYVYDMVDAQISYMDRACEQERLMLDLFDNGIIEYPDGKIVRMGTYDDDKPRKPFRYIVENQ